MSFGLTLSVSAADFTKAKRLAEQGNAQAQYNLGEMYIEGNGVAKYYTNIAKEWFVKASDNGNQKGCDEYKNLNK